MKLFYLFFGLYIFANIYVFIELRRWRGPGIWQWPVALWFLGMIGLGVVRVGMPPVELMSYLENLNYVWIGFILITLMCFAVANIVAILLKIASFVTNAQFTRLLPTSRRVPLALLAGIILSIYAVYDAQKIRVNHFTIATSKLPAGQERLRIAVLADIQIGGFVGTRTVKNVSRLTEAEKPDMLVMVGDIVDTDVSKDTENAELLASISAPAGKFAVNGNHEAYHGLEQAEDFIRRSDFTILKNDMVEAGGIMVAGIDDITVVERYGGESNPTPLLKQYDGDKFVLFLKHRPTGMHDAVGLFDLQLSGHTHGGQLWPGKYIVKYLHDNLAQGLTTFPKKNGRQSQLIISNGIGYWGPPMRLFASPEIIIVDLVPGTY